jgi:hypothetical protein
MDVMTPSHNLEDIIGFNLFSSAWDYDQDDSCLADGYQLDLYDRTSYLLQFQQERAINNQLDRFSVQLHDHLQNEPPNQPAFLSSTSLAQDELDGNLGFVNPPFCGDNVARAQQSPCLEPQNLVDPMQEIAPCYISTSSIETWHKGLSPVEWNYEVEADSSPARLPTALADKPNITMSSGYIQPAIVYPVSKESTSPTKTDMADTMSIHQDEDIPSIDGTRKGKKPRKSRKKPRSKEDEELKRNLSLERNRQAANRCRMKSKEWVKGLETKAHQLSVESKAKEAEIKELTKEIVQLRSELFIHSRLCDEEDIVIWVQKEAAKVKLRSSD